MVRRVARRLVAPERCSSQVTTMSDAIAGNFLGTEYDAFLFAPIGEDSNGMLLSVVSALVRLDLDPWQEASDLTRLPIDAAVTRLATLIAALPDQLSAHRDSGTIAARVIALLPHGRVSAIKGKPGSRLQLKSQTLWYGLFGVVVLIGLAQLLISSRADPGSTARSSASHAPKPHSGDDK